MLLTYKHTIGMKIRSAAAIKALYPGTLKIIPRAKKTSGIISKPCSKT